MPEQRSLKPAAPPHAAHHLLHLRHRLWVLHHLLDLRHHVGVLHDLLGLCHHIRVALHHLLSLLHHRRVLHHLLHHRRIEAARRETSWHSTGHSTGHSARHAREATWSWRGLHCCRPRHCSSRRRWKLGKLCREAIPVCQLTPDGIIAKQPDVLALWSGIRHPARRHHCLYSAHARANLLGEDRVGHLDATVLGLRGVFLHVLGNLEQRLERSASVLHCRRCGHLRQRSLEVMIWRVRSSGRRHLSSGLPTLLAEGVHAATATSHAGPHVPLHGLDHDADALALRS
mmetsp:Transcript_21369/g.47309  ORF Transcript_21369/g.47309 Transcript_21369/m.47309 type:complete len:286 (+) Transcript_21369:114-971(+)